MKDSLEKDDQTPVISIIKEFAWYLKESARKLDNDVSEVRRDSKSISDRVLMLEMQVKTCMEKIMERYDNIEEKIDTKFKTLEDNKKVGWTVAEKIIAVIVFILTFGLSVLAYLK